MPNRPYVGSLTDAPRRQAAPTQLNAWKELPPLAASALSRGEPLRVCVYLP